MSQSPPFLWTIGLNHESAPLDVRARLAIAPEKWGTLLIQLKESITGLAETALLSTCNRTELYGLSHLTQQKQALAWLEKHSHLSQETLAPHLYIHEHEVAARHILQVASGLNSMVLGEPQILGQVKQAARMASNAGTLGATLHQLFKQAFSVAKDVRTQTEIGAHSISMAAAATRLAANVFEDWQHTRVLLVGAGEMIELCAAHFASKQPKNLSITNRTLERAQNVATRFSPKEHPISIFALSELPAKLHEFDVVVSCTASLLPIIGLGAVEGALKQRKHRPILMIDLAVPRDIEPQVKTLADIYLYTVDDLSGIVQTNLANRAAALEHAQHIVEAGLQQFLHWQTARQNHVPKIQALNEQAALWQEQEIERVKKQLLKNAPASPEAIDHALQTLARNLSNKFLHLAYKSI